MTWPGSRSRLINISEITVLSQKLLVSSHLRNLTVLNYKNQIAVFKRRNAVTYNKGGVSLTLLFY